jgi:Lipocalin-like domain
MKHHISAFLVVAVASWAGSWPALSADDPSQIVGTWQLISHSAVILDTNETQHNYGEHPTGYIQYSPGGHLVSFITTGDLKRPATASYTDAERSEIYKGIAGGYAGTYTIQGNTVIHHLLTAWRPEWVGSDQTRSFKIEGKHLTITTAPIKNQTGQDVVAILTFERVE